MQANYLHAGHDHSWAEHLLEPLEPMLPGGEKTVGFLGHLLADAGQIYLMLLVVMFAVFLLQTYIDTDRMQRKLAGLKNIWGYLLAFGLGVISPFCSCSIVPVLMGLIAVGVPMSVCLCMLTTASLLNLTAVTALYSLEGVGFASVYLVCSLVIVALSSFLLSRCDLRDAARDYHLAEHHHHRDDDPQAQHQRQHQHQQTGPEKLLAQCGLLGHVARPLSPQCMMLLRPLSGQRASTRRSRTPARTPPAAQSGAAGRRKGG